MEVIMVGFIMVYELNPLIAVMYIKGTTHFIRNIILFIIYINNIHETDVATNETLLPDYQHSKCISVASLHYTSQQRPTHDNV